MTHAELMERMSSQEINEWMAFAQFEPFGIESYYFGHAITASTVANRGRIKGEKVYKVSDFMPQFEKKEQGIDEMINFAATLTVGMGGTVNLREEDDNG